MIRIFLALSLLTSALSGCGASSSASTGNDATASARPDKNTYDAQVAEFSRQQREAARQLAEAERQLAAQDKLLSDSAALLDRQHALLAKQEQQVKRYDAILEKWERQQVR